MRTTLTAFERDTLALATDRITNTNPSVTNWWWDVTLFPPPDNGHRRAALRRLAKTGHLIRDDEGYPRYRLPLPQGPPP